MSNKQQLFYKVMYYLSLIAIGLNFIGIIFAIVSWFIQITGKAISNKIKLGVVDFKIPEQLVENGTVFTHLFFIMSLILLGLTAFLLINIKNIFHNLKQQSVFIRKNAMYIRNIAWIVIVLSIIKNLPDVIQIWDIRNQMDSIMNVPFSVVYEMDFGLLFSGLSILAVAQIFKQAVKIAEENQLTI